jgi:hypothetical protein
MNETMLAKDVHLFSTKPTVQRITRAFAANDYLFGQRDLQTPNEPNGMVVRYYLKAQSSAKPAVVITDATGKEMARLAGTANAGINTVVWNTRAVQEAAGRGGRGGRGGGGGGRGGYSPEMWAPLGEYTVTLDIDGKQLTQKARIAKTQGWSIGAVPQIIRQ